MNQSRRGLLLKMTACLLAGLLAIPADHLPAQSGAPRPVSSSDDILTMYNEAKTEVLAGKYSLAKFTLDRLLADISKRPMGNQLQGEIYLLAGVTHEQLKYHDLAFQYFCQAKQLLGKDKGIAGLDLRHYRQYRRECPAPGASEKVASHKGGGSGKTLLTLLGLGVLAVGGYLLYAKVIKKNSSSNNNNNYQVRSSCFTTAWNWTVTANWDKAIGTLAITPDPRTRFPLASENNNWEDQVTYTITGNGTLVSVDFVIQFTVSGGDNVTRRDIVYLDGNVLFDQTNTYLQPCSNRTVFNGYTITFTKNSFGVSFTLKHKASFTVNNAILATLRNVSGQGDIKIRNQISRK